MPLIKNHYPKHIFHWFYTPAILSILFLGLFPTPAFTQRPIYQITATLDTAHHTVSGDIQMTYTNRSSRSLDSLGLHLWPNAYRNNQTALVEQMVRLGNLKLWNAKEADRGEIKDLHFISPNHEIRLVNDLTYGDIAWLLLKDPLLPGETIHLSSSFSVKVPVSFSRLGRTGDAYQLTQWYPHLAVFDGYKWHTMPYLDQGEFYNDFADYTVTIRAPQGYTIAATGQEISSSLKDNLLEVTFRADNVIDFAWFASPTFRQQKSIITLEGGKQIELYLYIDSLYNDLWDRAAAYAERALQFYSDWLGSYPYPRMSVVYAPLSEGGYMEYPMLAQIGLTADSAFLDEVIAHEIGHTWLYGILANDERTHPWLDEGMNSFIERRYMATYHPDYEEQVVDGIFHGPHSMNEYDAFQHYLRFSGKVDPPEADPQIQSAEQYLYSAYVLPPQGLEMMMSMEGEDVMKKMFNQYFNEHQFTHVTPGDVRSSFESVCDCNLSWFFEDWLYHAHEVDYQITKFNAHDKEVTIENKSTSLIPLQLSAYNDDHKVLSHWLDGFRGKKIFHMDDRADQVRLYESAPAVNKNWRSDVKPKPLFPSVSLLPKIGSYDRNTMSVTPFFGTNLTDGFMPGLAFMSGLLPQHHFKWLIAPMYGTQSHEFLGHAEGRYISDFKRGLFEKFLISMSVDRFGYNIDTQYLFRDHYLKWSPSVALRLRHESHYSRLTQWLSYRYVHIDQDYGKGLNAEDGIYTEETRDYGVHELAFLLKSDATLEPYSAMAFLQAGTGFLRFNVKYKQHFVGKNKMTGVWLHGFGGWLPVYDQPEAYVPLTMNGLPSNGYSSSDYMYDEWLPGRNATDGLFAHQVFMKDAGLKTLSTIGISSTWMLGGGVSAAMPFKVLHFYMDATLYHADITGQTALTYSGGAAIVIWKDVFEIYIPFLESKDIRESTYYSFENRDKWFERISFQANFKLANPLNILDHQQLGYGYE